MPFYNKVTADLYNAIVTDEVEYRPTLSHIARNLIMQVGRHNAEQTEFLFYFKTSDFIYSARANSAITMLDISDIRSYHIHHVVLYVCMSLRITVS